MEGKRNGRREGNGKREQESERGGRRWSERDRPENRLDSCQGPLLPSLYPYVFCSSLYPKLVLPPRSSCFPQGPGGTVLCISRSACFKGRALKPESSKVLKLERKLRLA